MITTSGTLRPPQRNKIAQFALCSLLTLLPTIAGSEVTSGLRAPEKIIIDTDIGADIDDAFAVALALQSPELDILGFSTAFGDTAARAGIIDRMLGETGRGQIPVAVGSPTAAWQIGRQRRYGDGGQYARASHPAAVDFILEQINKFPHQITLITIGPLTNVGALIDKDAATFRKLKQVVLMGGWVNPVMRDYQGIGTTPMPEYNVKMDVASAQKLFRSGVQLYVIPLDATYHLALEELDRLSVFTQATPLTNSLAVLYLLSGMITPVLHDALPIAFLVNPELCRVKSMNIVVDDDGLTRSEHGPPNAKVCLRSDRQQFMDYYMGRVAGGRT